MEGGLSPLDTAHRGPIHAAELDHFGRRLATASSDSTVRVWDLETRRPIATLAGHKGSVWAVSWSHPRYGPLLASAGEDRCVLLWREAESEWVEVHRMELQGAVLAASFGPWEYGLQLAAACSDGKVVLLSLRRSPAFEPEGAGEAPLLQLVEQPGWYENSFQAHEGGVFALSWGPATSSSQVIGGPAVDSGTGGATAGAVAVLWPRHLVTGGADQQVRIYCHDEHTDEWVFEHRFTPGEHGGWIRDVAWRPNVGMASNTIASCAEDGTIVIWSQTMAGQPWLKQAKWELGATYGCVWQLSWSVTGSILAASTSVNEVLTYKETLDGGWQRVEIPQEGSDAAGGAGADRGFSSSALPRSSSVSMPRRAIS